jgi:hypothetical protein
MDTDKHRFSATIPPENRLTKQCSSSGSEYSVSGFSYLCPSVSIWGLTELFRLKKRDKTAGIGLVPRQTHLAGRHDVSVQLRLHSGNARREWRPAHQGTRPPPCRFARTWAASGAGIRDLAPVCRTTHPLFLAPPLFPIPFYLLANHLWFWREKASAEVLNVRGQLLPLLVNDAV